MNPLLKEVNDNYFFCLFVVLFGSVINDSNCNVYKSYFLETCFGHFISYPPSHYGIGYVCLFAVFPPGRREGGGGEGEADFDGTESCFLSFSPPK